MVAARAADSGGDGDGACSSTGELTEASIRALLERFANGATGGGAALPQWAGGEENGPLEFADLLPKDVTPGAIEKRKHFPGPNNVSAARVTHRSFRSALK
jgi:hypothetical protein